MPALVWRPRISSCPHSQEDSRWRRSYRAILADVPQLAAHPLEHISR